jgi:hypothetical protein
VWHTWYRREGKLTLTVMRMERERSQACKVVQGAWRNYRYIRTPLNKRADARRRAKLLRFQHHCARVIQVGGAKQNMKTFDPHWQARGPVHDVCARLRQDAWNKHHNYAAYLLKRDQERDRRRKMGPAARGIQCMWRRYDLRQVTSSS